MDFNIQRVYYGLPHAMYAPIFHYIFFSMEDPGVFFAHFSMTTHTDFQFAAAVVQTLWLVMVALAKNWLSVHYTWSCHGASHTV